MQKFKNAALLLMIFVLLSACNTRNKEDHSGHDMESDIYYTCSMDPQVRESKPGKCPICHMELIAVKMDKSVSNEIKLSNQQMRLGNIKTQTIEESSKSVDEVFTGVLTFNQERQRVLAARAMGRIEKMFVKSEGDYVKKNQAVYQLYSEPIAIAKQDYLAAYRQLSMPGDFGKNARSLLNSAKQKLEYYGLTASQVDRIKSTGDVSSYTTFYSSYRGTVSEIVSAEGSYVMEGHAIMRMADFSDLWLETQVNISNAGNLKIGQSAMVSIVGYPEKTVDAKISFINPEIDPDSRLISVRFEIPNPNGNLKPGMQAVVKLRQADNKGFYIPVDAVIRNENASYIWVEKSYGVFEHLMVETGMESNGMIEIKSEIDTTKKIVVSGAYGINSEYIFRKGADPMQGMKM